MRMLRLIWHTILAKNQWATFPGSILWTVNNCSPNDMLQVWLAGWMGSKSFSQLCARQIGGYPLRHLSSKPSLITVLSTGGAAVYWCSRREEGRGFIKQFKFIFFYAEIFYKINIFYNWFLLLIFSIFCFVTRTFTSLYTLVYNIFLSQIVQ